MTLPSSQRSALYSEIMSFLFCVHVYVQMSLRERTGMRTRISALTPATGELQRKTRDPTWHLSDWRE